MEKGLNAYLNVFFFRNTTQQVEEVFDCTRMVVQCRHSGRRLVQKPKASNLRVHPGTHWPLYWGFCSPGAQAMNPEGYSGPNEKQGNRGELPGRGAVAEYS